MTALDPHQGKSGPPARQAPPSESTPNFFGFRIFGFRGRQCGAGTKTTRRPVHQPASPPRRSIPGPLVTRSTEGGSIAREGCGWLRMNGNRSLGCPVTCRREYDTAAGSGRPASAVREKLGDDRESLDHYFPVFSRRANNSRANFIASAFCSAVMSFSMTARYFLASSFPFAPAMFIQAWA